MESFCVVGPLVVGSGVVVDAEESSLVLLNGTAGREEHPITTLLNSMTCTKRHKKAYRRRKWTRVQCYLFGLGLHFADFDFIVPMPA